MSCTLTDFTMFILVTSDIKNQNLQQSVFIFDWIVLLMMKIKQVSTSTKADTFSF